MEDHVKRLLRLSLLTLLTLPALVAPAAEPALSLKERVLWQALERRLGSIAERADGLVAFSLKDLKTGATLELRAGEVLPTASTIKAAVLYELYRQAEAGGLDLGESTRPPLPRVKGGGILQELGGDVRLTWRDLAALMMGFSDNEASNLLMDRVGLPAVNERLAGLGLRQTKLRRHMMDLAAARRGDENVSTAAELRRLAELLREAPGLAPERARDMFALASMAKTSVFREVLPEGLVVADKPGELEGVRAVCAYVELPERPYAIAVMSGYLKSDRDGDQAIREISAAVYSTFDRLARASEFGRIISER